MSLFYPLYIMNQIGDLSDRISLRKGDLAVRRLTNSSIGAGASACRCPGAPVDRAVNLIPLSNHELHGIRNLYRQICQQARLFASNLERVYASERVIHTVVRRPPSDESRWASRFRPMNRAMPHQMPDLSGAQDSTAMHGDVEALRPLTYADSI